MLSDSMLSILLCVSNAESRYAECLNAEWLIVMLSVLKLSVVMLTVNMV
jgi:hypothetical protein